MLHSSVQAPAGRLTVADLWTSEQLALFGMRGWLAGPAGRDLVEQVFWRVFGLAEVELALNGMGALCRVLCDGSRRGFRAQCAECQLVGHDELCVLGILASCQAEDEACAKAFARWLALPRRQRALIDACDSFADFLKRHALALPNRSATCCEQMCRMRREAGRQAIWKS